MSENLLLSYKPEWLLGCGAGLGLGILLLIWGVLTLVNRRAGAAVLDLAGQTVIWPVLVTAALLAGGSLITTILDSAGGYRIFDQKAAAWRSVPRLASVGPGKPIIQQIPPKAPPQQYQVHIRDGELSHIVLDSDRDFVVTVNTPDSADRPDEDRIHLKANETYEWDRGREALGPLAGKIDSLYVSSDADPAAWSRGDLVAQLVCGQGMLSLVPTASGIGFVPPAVAAVDREIQERTAANLVIRYVTQPVVPQAAMIPITAAGLVGYFCFFALLGWGAPKVSAVALATAREAMAQPLFYLLLSVGAVFLMGLVFTPFFTFGEDVRQYKDSGLTVIMVFTIMFAVWTASVSVAEEIEGRTALTVLSKPIGRRQFILGKYLGILAPVAVAFILLGIWFLLWTSYKVVYDARESADPNIMWQDCYAELAQTVPGLVLAFMETAVLAAISVAISTRLPLLPNLVICTSIYMVGHLVPLLVQSTVGHNELVRFMGQLFATVLPVLDHFNIYAAVAAGAEVPASYIAWVGLYSLNYIAIALLLALAMFEDRDLA